MFTAPLALHRPHVAAPLLAPALLLLLAGTAPAVPSFTEQVEFGAGSTITVAWGDPDGDGDLDLAVGNVNLGQNHLHLNDGSAAFTDTAEFELSNTFAMVWGDYDNDGDQDMAVGNQNQSNRLFINNGDGTFTGRNRFGGFTINTIALAWADANLDGLLDMAVGNGILGNDQDNLLFLNNGDGSFTAQNQFGGLQTGSVVWGDYDNDGDPDLAVGNGGFGAEQQNYLYVNNGDGTYTGVPEFGLGDTASLVWGDADNDGDLDLAVANWNAGQNYLYRNDGGSFAALPRFGVRDPNTMAWGDFDNDGDLDLAVGNGDFGSADFNYLYVNEGGLNFTESAQFGEGSTDAVAWGDVDGDGDLDLAVGNEHTPTQNYLYINNENDADWLFVHLTGRFHELGAGYSNRDGVGAKVLVYDAGFVGDPAHLLGVREVEAHGGFSAQNAIDAHFGLPGHATVDLRVVWPGSGGTNITQDVPGVSVPGRHTIVEGTVPVSAPAVHGSAAQSLWKAVPNPSSHGAVLQYQRPWHAGMTLEVLDVTGRVVKSLDASANGTSARAVWDGRDAASRPVAAGVYFVREPGVPGAGRLTVLR